MENSCLTFVTPTLVAGDRSEVDVAAHEISHVRDALYHNEYGH
jgi:leukotriene-A4 hydrolase